MVGIGSSRLPTATNLDGLDFYTNGSRRVSISAIGRVGINNVNPQYLLDVNGTINANYLYVNGISSAGSIFTDYDLNADDDLSVGGDATIIGNVGIGTSYSTSYKLRVVGNAIITTTLEVGGKITNAGKGIVKSNSGTTLRQGFSSGAFALSLNAGQHANVNFCITKFEGDNDNVRVMVAQFIAGSGASSTAGNINFQVIGTVANGGSVCGGGSYATVRISNPTSASINLGSTAILYLFTVVTD